MRERKTSLPSSFIESQKEIIIFRLSKYKDRKRIEDELKARDVSEYTLYKQKEVVPHLKRILRVIEETPQSYGVCISCGGDIEISHLKLIPTALLCKACM
ncbi:MAG: TraR/DksA C4-type zinc finger protein [Patescibacteria group bacterium]|jgi:RNA polymerase-binding transcription factor DksA|nr:TraR/DksA C4-type zinc finger protein [Patescibacteria group bacterium]